MYEFIKDGPQQISPQRVAYNMNTGPESYHLMHLEQLA